jgi:flagellar motor protein MotB
VSKGKLAAVCFIWLILVGIAAMAWRWFVTPTYQQAAAEKAEQERKQLIEATTSDPHHRLRVQFALDAFSGYAILRSPEFHKYLSEKRIAIDLHDDSADYARRLRSLQQGEIQMAAFTIDALIKVSAQLAETPATIVAIIDETRGADAMLASKSVIPNIEALNRADMRFRLISDSPSETLARVVMTDFKLDSLRANPDPFQPVADQDAILQAYRQSKPGTAEAYVLWEPYVSRMLAEHPEVHVVVDSSWFRGYIVDVIVTSRDFLAKNKDIVRDVVGSYLRAVYQHRDNMVQLVRTDGRLGQTEAEKLVRGIQWKNTLDNFDHMGLLSTGQSGQHIEGMISRITHVLVETGAISGDPASGDVRLFYYPEILRELQSIHFHPALADESLHDEEVQLPRLSEDEWTNLREIGQFRVPPLVFAPGTDTLRSHSQVTLDDLAEKLQAWPRSYLAIRGNVSGRGDVEANRSLALRRAQVAAKYLIEKGVSDRRIRAEAGSDEGTTVSFVLGHSAY